MIEQLLAYGWWVAVVFIIAGFVALVKGADWLVDGASSIAKRFGISDLVIGLTVVAFGTSMPEFVVNMVSVVEGSTDLAITNILGSNIINTFVILGLTALVYPIVSRKRSRDFDIPLSIIAGVLVLIFVAIQLPFGESERGVGRMGGIVLLVFFCYFLYITFRHAKDHMASWALATMVGVDGSPRWVSIAILIDNAVNLFLDIVFIKWLGWGIEGSSAATVLGHVVGIAIMSRHFFYPENHLKIRLSGAAGLMRDIISQGLPLAAASICLTVLLYSANSIVLGSMGRVGIFAFSVCMNLLQIYNLFLSGTCRTLQSLGSIQVGKGDSQTFWWVLRKSFRFITIAMLITCVAIWLFPEEVARLFGADEQELIAESVHALRIFALSFIPFCYIYTLMIVYKLYGYHKIALFISLALSLTVIPVLWLMGRYAPEQLWYSYLIAYAIEAALIFLFHKIGHVEFKLK